MALPDTATPWLSIVGIGEDGIDGLSPAAQSLIASATLVVGGERHLRLIGGAAREVLAWPTPMDTGFAQVLARRGQPVVVLASGDPFNHGVGVVLARHVPMAEMRSYPQPSSLSLAANRLGWALQEVACIGLNGRAIERVLPLLQPGARILALSADAGTPAAVAKLLAANGFGGTNVTVLEALGGPRERIRSARADGFDMADIAALNLLALSVAAGRGARVLPRCAGLPDEWFESDGQLTKREVRAITLASLAPKRGEHLWDLGCGSGSIAIEWLLADASCRATAVELKPERAARAARNALAFGVPGLRVEVGRAGDIIDRLDAPQAVFIGGGAREDGLIDRVWARLATGGRLALNAVTLETEALVLAEFTRKGGNLTRIAIDRADPVGGLTGWRPAMPVVHWLAVKP
jgi:precorrin-6Y C5,15-methyltransferase (decarboxylating)